MPSTMLRSCSLSLVETLLKVLKNLSLESQALSHLENYHVIPTLIPLLACGVGTPHANFQSYILPTLFNLCRINKRRQEQAALHGVIPYLQNIIETDSHLKQFALPIICDLAHTSDITRKELMKVVFISVFIGEGIYVETRYVYIVLAYTINILTITPRKTHYNLPPVPFLSIKKPFNHSPLYTLLHTLLHTLSHILSILFILFSQHGGGAAFYIDLLQENYWQSFALNSLAVWLANDKVVHLSYSLTSYHIPYLTLSYISSLTSFYISSLSSSLIPLHVPSDVPLLQILSHIVSLTLTPSPFFFSSMKDYVEPLILQPEALSSLVEFFRSSSVPSIRMLHKPFLVGFF